MAYKLDPLIYKAILLLEENNKRTNLTGISRAINRAPSNVSRALDRLEINRDVRRDPDSKEYRWVGKEPSEDEDVNLPVGPTERRENIEEETLEEKFNRLIGNAYYEKWKVLAKPEWEDDEGRLKWMTDNITIFATCLLAFEGYVKDIMNEENKNNE